MKVLALLIVIYLHLANSQLFQIGILDEDVYNYIQLTVYANLTGQNPAVVNFSLTLLSLPDLTSSVNYAPALATLQLFDVIIGRFNFTIASMCQQLNLTYFYLDNFLTTFPGALLDATNDLIMGAQMLLLYLSKYNINHPFRLISDGGYDTINFRLGLNETTVAQCNFNQSDTASTINQCYQSVFQGSVLSNYICISNEGSTTQLDTAMQQSLYMSLPYSSMMFFPVAGILPLMTKYYYSGGYLFQLTQENPSGILTGTLLQRNALASFFLVVNSLSPYSKLSKTTWMRNNVTSSFTSGTILNIIKSTNGVYQSNGQRAMKQYYLYVISSGRLTMVTTFTYNNGWTESKGIPNPATGGSKESIAVVYTTDTAFITEVNSTSGIIIQGYSVDLLTNLLLPIQLSYNAMRPNNVSIVGTLVNGLYTGMLGEMYAKRYNMTAYPVPIVQSFRMNLTYSDPILDTQYSMLIRRANVSVQYLLLLQPYSPMVWLFIVGTIIVLSLILFFTNMISPNISSSSDKLTINNSTFMVFGSFLIAKMLVKPAMFSTQIFYLLIWLGTLLIIASYVSNLVIQIGFSNSTKISFTTFLKLYNQKNYKWVFVNNSYLYNSIMLDNASGTNSLYVQMFNYAKDNWKDKYILEPENVEGFALNNSDFGVLNDAIHNTKISLSNCRLTTVIDSSYSFSLAYVLNPDFQYSQKLSNQILLLKQNGVEGNINSKYFQTGPCPSTIIGSSGIPGFTYQDMCGIFILIMIGISLSLNVALIEFILSKFSLQCQRASTGNSLQFGAIYKAKVKALDKNGVTVDIGRQSLFSRKDDARIFYVHKKFLGRKSKNTTDIPSPTEQGIMIGTTLLLKYIGNSPEDSKRKFVQVVKSK